jgi:hypothetical protein
VQFLPTDIRSILQTFHYVGDAYRLLPYHNAEFASMLKFFAINSKRFVLENCLLIFAAEEGVRADVIVRLLVDWLEDGGICKGHYIFGHDIRQLFVMFDLILFEQTQTIQTT